MLLEVDDLNDVSVVVLEGEGREFCAGYDPDDGYINGQTIAVDGGYSISYR